MFNCYNLQISPKFRPALTDIYPAVTDGSTSRGACAKPVHSVPRRGIWPPGIDCYMNLSRPRDTSRAAPDFSLVFPMYNPGSRLPTTLAALTEFARNSNRCWEFVFVADGCTDNSLDRLRSWAANYPATRIIDYTPNRGKGHAVRQGLLAASAPFRIFTDIDLAYSFDEIERIATALHGGAEVAIASRTHPQSHLVVQPHSLGYAYRRQVQSAVFGLMARTILPLKQHDTQAGLKGMTESAVRRIVPHMTCAGFGFDCELLTACVRLGISVMELPVNVHCSETVSTTNFRSTLKMVGDLFRIRKAWPANKTLEPVATPSVMRYREAG